MFKNKNLIDQIANTEGYGIKNKNPVLDPNLTVDQLKDQADAPLFIDRELLQSAEIDGDNVTFDPKPPAIVPETAPIIDKQQGNFNTDDSGDLNEGENENSNNPLKVYQDLLNEYRTKLDKNFNSPEVAQGRKRDDLYRTIGLVGDSLAKLSQGGSQKRLGIPGVEITGAGMSRAAEAFTNNESRATRDRLEKQKQLLSELEAVQDAARLEQQNIREQNRLDMQDRLERGREGRFLQALGYRKDIDDRRQDFTELKGNRLSDKQVEGISGIDKVSTMLDEIKNRAGNFKDKLGPYASRIERGKNLVPGMQEDPDYAAFKSTVIDQLSQYIKSLSGLTVSEAERKALLESAPKVEDKYDVFISKTNEMQKRLGDYRKTELDAVQKQGKNTAPFEQSSPQTNSAQKELSMIDEYAKMYNLSKEQARTVLQKRGHVK